MNITINPSHLAGIVNAPPSKSLTQRAIAAGLLAHGKTVIHNSSLSGDSMAAVRIAQTLGASVSVENDIITVDGANGLLSTAMLNCGESGLALRMFSPISSLLSEKVILTGEGSLTSRPVTMITEGLSQLGVKVETNHGLLPVYLTGRLRGGKAVIDGSASSQLLSGLLMALPVSGNDSEIKVLNLRSKPYISMTLQLLSDFGITIRNNDFTWFSIEGKQSYNPREYVIEGDWSGASFLLVAGALSGEVTVKGLNNLSQQADRAVMQPLKDAGCQMKVENDSITTFKSDLHAFSFDATDSPDLFPPLVALAAQCEGTSRIKGMSRLIYKESNRASAIMEVLAAMKIPVHTDGDFLFINGGTINPAIVSSYNDHRIAMMAAVLATTAIGNITIKGAESVAKSFPEFYDTLTLLGARMI